jgi:hypothetical protein
MKKTLFFYLIIQYLNAFTQNNWEKTYPVSTTKSVGRDITNSSDGNLFFVGEIDFPAPNGVFKHYVRILKINLMTGDIVWENIVKEGETKLETANSIREKPDGTILTAGFSDYPDTRMYCVAANQQGDTIFTKKIPAAVVEVAYVVRPMQNGDFILAGTKLGGDKTAKAYRLTADGTVLWSKLLTLPGGTSGEGVIDMEFTSDGNLVLLYSLNNGIGVTKMNLEGEIIFTQNQIFSNYDIPTAMVATPDGGFLVSSIANGIVGSNPLLSKFDITGTILWQKALDYLAHTVYSIEINHDNDGYILGMAGKPSGTTNGKVYFVKTDLEGDIVWAKSFAGAYERFVVVPTPSGGYIGAGTRNESMLLISTDSIQITNETFESEGDENRLIIAPNPSTTEFEILTKNIDNELIKYQLFDKTGRIVKEGFSPKNVVDVADLVVGIYFLRVSIGKNIHHKKIMVD